MVYFNFLSTIPLFQNLLCFFCLFCFALFLEGDTGFLKDVQIWRLLMHINAYSLNFYLDYKTVPASKYQVQSYSHMLTMSSSVLLAKMFC